MEIQKVKDGPTLSQTAADIFVQAASLAIEKHGLFSVLLAGGSTPKNTYHVLGSSAFKSKVHWSKVHFFFGDERTVPSDDPGSNFQMAWESFLRELSAPKENIHRVRTELENPVAIAADYAEEIKKFFVAHKRDHFDFAFLGLGNDGHTASLFPDGELKSAEGQTVFASWVPSQNTNRISVSRDTLNNTDQVVFLVEGKGKAEIIRNVLEGIRREDGSLDPNSSIMAMYPAQTIRPKSGKLTWLLDEAAASLL